MILHVTRAHYPTPKFAYGTVEDWETTNCHVGNKPAGLLRSVDVGPWPVLIRSLLSLSHGKWGSCRRYCDTVRSNTAKALYAFADLTAFVSLSTSNQGGCSHSMCPMYDDRDLISSRLQGHSERRYNKTRRWLMRPRALRPIPHL